MSRKAGSKAGGFERIGDLMEGAVDRLGLGSDLEFSRLRDRWAEVVGAEAARFSTPLGLESGTLKVAVQDQAWSQNLVLFQSEIIERIKEQRPQLRVRKLKFRVDQDREYEAAEPEPEPDAGPDPAAGPETLPEALERGLEEIDDPGLRTAAEKVIRITLRQ